LKPRRLLNVAFRTAHLLGMGVVLGGVALGAGRDRLGPWILLTLLSGGALLGLDLLKGPDFLSQGSGAALLLKLLLLLLGNLFPAARFPFYLAATAVASAGSHMPGAWRHFSFRHGHGHGRVVESEGP
jgi:hypothetical protein